MDRAVLLRSSLACTRTVCRGPAHRLARLSSKRHRPIPSLHRRSFLRNHLRLITTASPPSLHLKSNFCPLSTRAIATSSPQSATDVVEDDVAEKLGFEKVSEQFIEECKSKAVLYKHKKTGAEIMSVANDDENKNWGYELGRLSLVVATFDVLSLYYFVPGHRTAAGLITKSQPHLWHQKSG
ncbi:hypothetical protein RJ639_042111 [Escallonia herrerae]|uniref:Uncharacterized protein n=1 Tax=Escallonia herrerae TaxID=1293975 RepID=A0AA88WHZ9_9ASTE|nr:hypothetical protein RJ639_042111 [Escallonia herrerae]